MSKVTVATANGHVIAAKGGRTKAVKAGHKVLAVLRPGQRKLVWLKPAGRWSLPTLRVVQLTSKRQLNIRRLSPIDVLSPAR